MMIRPRATHLAAVALLLPSLVVSIAGCPFSAETFHRHCTVVADCNDENPCTEDKCTAGICENPNKAKEAACPAGVCDGSGKCVECLTNTDCATKDPQTPVCDTSDHSCVSCEDGKKNGKETGVDCGGPDCGACPGEPCDPMNGCGQQGSCSTKDGICCDKSCNDACESCAMAKTGKPDGICSPIPLGMDPNGECMMKGGCGATAGKCRCDDGVKNVDETDIDCGGPTCSGCEGGKTCGGDMDCAPDVPNCDHGACCQVVCAACSSCNMQGTCTAFPAGTSDPECMPNQACGQPGAGCIGKAGAPCSVNGKCLSQLCLTGSCQQSPAGKPCNSDPDCVTGTTCKNLICSP